MSLSSDAAYTLTHALSHETTTTCAHTYTQGETTPGETTRAGGDDTAGVHDDAFDAAAAVPILIFVYL